LIAGAPYVLPLAQKHGVHILPAGMRISTDELSCVLMYWVHNGAGSNRASLTCK